MKIGIVGVGVVGGAVKYGMEKLGHDIRVHDLKLKTTIDAVMDTDICFVCVPTQSKEDGSCNVNAVYEIARQLATKAYSGILAIKSTVEPGTTRYLRQVHSCLRICFVPEFLRERCAVADFMENHDLCVVGTDDVEVFLTIKEAHGRYPRKVIMMQPTEAEFVKYFNNVYNATLVTLANAFYDLCKAKGANYAVVKDALTQRDHIFNRYLDCNENFRGFGGACLPKDTRVMAHLAKKLETGVKFFDALLQENARVTTTLIPGMRGEDKIVSTTQPD